MINIIIVEDELLIQDSIVEIIENHCTDAEVVGKATSIEEAKKIIPKHNPDLVLLDVNLTDGTSFELLEQVSSIKFKIIFITAFEEYALKAIRLSAVDFIVKPIDPFELINAINKVKNVIGLEGNSLKINALLANIKNLYEKSKKIVLKTAESIYLIDIQDIIRCESDGAYTHFYINDGKNILISKVLKEYEELLEECGFMRVHKSHMVNLKYVDEYKKVDGGSLVLKDKSEIPVSFRKKDQLISLFDELSKL